MTYRIERTVYNGYRCCCYHEWTQAFTEDTLASVVLPTTVAATCLGNDSYLSSLEVVDNDTGSTIFHGYLTYPSGLRTRGSGYRASRWSGIHNGVAFEDIVSDLPAPKPTTWDGVLAALKADDEARERLRLERELANTQAELDKLSSNR